MDRRAEIQEDMSALLRDIFARGDLVVTPATSAADVAGWDSMKLIEITIAVEEKYNIRLRAREVDSLRNVGDLIALIVEKTK